MYLYAYFSGKIYMADVTGDLGGQPIQLNNAATEATLKQLLAAMTVIANNTGKDKGAQAKSKAELEKELKKLADAAKNQTRQTDTATKAQKNLNQSLTDSAAQSKRAQELAEKSEQATVFAMDKLEQFGHTARDSVIKLTNVMSSFAGMGNSFSGAAATFNNIPVIGGMLGTVFGAVAGAADKLYTSFKTAGSVGASFGGSISAMNTAASGAGLTFDQFAGIIKNNAADLAVFGGSTGEGAKRMANMAKELRKTNGALAGTQDDLARLGYSSEDINAGFAKYSAMMAKSGGLQGKSDIELAAGTANYLKQLDAVAKLTGQTKDAQEQENARRMADAKNRQMLARLGEDAANAQTFLNTIPASMRKGAEEYFATGVAQSDAAKEFVIMFGEGAEGVRRAGEESRRTGKFSQESAVALDRGLRNAAKNADMALVETTAMYTDSFQGAATAVYEYQSQQGDLGDSFKKQAEERAAAEKTAKTAMDPAQMLKFQQTIAETSNKFNELLANVLPKLQGAFTLLANFVQDWLVPAFNFFAKHIELITVGIGALIVVMAVLKTTIASMKAYEAWKAKGELRGSKSMPMYVQDVGGGGGIDTDGPDKKKKGAKGAKGAASSAKGLVKGLGVAGAVLSVGMLASDISDINEKEKSGEITKREADVGKGEAVGGAAGGAAGALGGAAAGAAIGSVVPVIGTVIGGAIGAAIGGYLGMKGGEVAGKATAELVVGPPGAGEKGTEQWLKINDPNINKWVDAVYEGREKIGAVPGVYLPYVKERLAKKPAKATPTATAGATNPPPGAATKAAEVPGINYSADSEALLKQFAARNNSVLAAPNNPSSANTSAPVTSAQNQLGQDAEKKAAEEARQRAAATDPKRLDQTSTQETQGIAITALNTNMEQMVKLLKDQVKLSENQISATKSLSSDLFAA